MRWILAIPLVFCSACLSQSSLDGFRLDERARQEGGIFFVEHQLKDERRLDRTIADVLQRRGLNVTLDPAETSDFTVTYVDRWQWDMRMYLIDLRINVRDTKTGVLLAAGRSYQTSLSAMGRSHDDIVDRAVGIVLDGTPAKTKPKSKPSRRRRR